MKQIYLNQKAIKKQQQALRLTEHHPQVVGGLMSDSGLDLYVV